MASYTHWEEEVYAVPLPTNWVEVSKVLNILTQKVKSEYDDAVKIEAYSEDDEPARLLFRYKIEEPK